MIVLEGTDLSGKSTLAAEIKRRYPYSPVKHLGLPPVGKRHLDLAREALLGDQMNTIYDRMMIGSWVFRHIKPDAHNINGVTNQELVDWCRMMNTLPRACAIRVVATDKDLMGRFSLRGDGYINEDELLKSQSVYGIAFSTWYSRTGIKNPCLTYSSSFRSARDFVDTHEKTIYEALECSATYSESSRALIRECMK